jgi:hypothetical protein
MTETQARPIAGGAPRAESCPRCGARFECGANTARCWCASLPALRELPGGLGSSCLCPNCLAELVAVEAK